jgi:hypothetical protein
MGLWDPAERRTRMTSTGGSSAHAQSLDSKVHGWCGHMYSLYHSVRVGSLVRSWYEAYAWAILQSVGRNIAERREGITSAGGR